MSGESAGAVTVSTDKRSNTVQAESARLSLINGRIVIDEGTSFRFGDYAKAPKFALAQAA